jgi:site-specific recombinase XerD
MRLGQEKNFMEQLVLQTYHKTSYRNAGDSIQALGSLRARSFHRFDALSAMVLLMLLAGLRKPEVLKLDPEDISFGQRTLTVKEGKGSHQRVVAISDTSLQELIN